MNRARDLNIPFDGNTGPWNAITDVPGVEVGYATLIAGEGKLEVGEGPVRTGVTAILPRGKDSYDPVFAGWFQLNGCGEMTGTAWLEESGFLEGPVLITNTHSVGVVRDAVVKWQVGSGRHFHFWYNPVVTETYDGYLNDINGFHVKEAHTLHAIQEAVSGPLEEGNVGGGTGMICFEFKGGTGTASRRLPESQGGYVVGVLVQTNFGTRAQLLVAGVPVGAEILKSEPLSHIHRDGAVQDSGSIVAIVATDAPLLPHQLERLAKRAALGVARTGGMAGNNSGDFFVAFSTANPGAARSDGSIAQVAMLSNTEITPLFNATALATEEAIINSLIAAQTMTGVDGHTVYALPHDRLREVMAKYRRLTA